MKVITKVELDAKELKEYSLNKLGCYPYLNWGELKLSNKERYQNINEFNSTLVCTLLKDVGVPYNKNIDFSFTQTSSSSAFRSEVSVGLVVTLAEKEVNIL